MNICIIDDDKSTAQMISKLLQLNGHESKIINDGREGLSTLEKENFDLVLLDLSMPDFSGLDILDELKASGRINDHKICILTASSAGQISSAELKDRGAKEVLNKPVGIAALMSTLEKMG